MSKNALVDRFPIFIKGANRSTKTASVAAMWKSVIALTSHSAQAGIGPKGLATGVLSRTFPSWLSGTGTACLGSRRRNYRKRRGIRAAQQLYSSV